MLGILLIDKPKGISSHDVVNDIRRKLGTRRVGHAGTLDPQATGMLVVAVGPATRFLQYLPLEPKEYVGEVTFGKETNTQDSEGEVVASGQVPENLREEIEAVLPQFRGLIQQLPPMFSAVKKAGKPLYLLARKGEEVEREPRTVHVDTAEILSIEGDVVRMRVVCSGGTYMRTLANDIGRAIGCGAYLSALDRTRVGKFDKTSAMPLSEAAVDKIVPLHDALPPVPLVSLNQKQTEAIREGRQVGMQDPPHGALCGLLDPQGEVFGMARIIGTQLQPECVIPLEAFHGTS